MLTASFNKGNKMMNTALQHIDEAASPLRYQRLAERVADTITSGVLRPGERLLSVRQACNAYQLAGFVVGPRVHQSPFLRTD